jgi:HNH endonuclease
MLNVTDKQFKAFWAKVKVSDTCWEWDAALYSNGYGHFIISGKDHLAHKVSFQLFGNSIPEGLVLRHTCDNRKCVRPDHLIPGTHSENLRDCVERGRLNPGRLFGESNAASVLTVEDVRKIRHLFTQGYSLSAISRKFGVGVSAIHSIKHGKTWKGVE